MTIKEPRELSPEDKLRAFKKATHGMEGSEQRWQERAEKGLTDYDLKAALEYEIGIYGGSCGPGEISLTFQAAGLKIWADWNSAAPDVTGKPIFQGEATIRIAREFYDIKDPIDTQLALF